MTSVGHSITGLTIAVLFSPKLTGIIQKLRYYLLFLFCALIPDIEIQGWGHHKYHISHSMVLMGAMVSTLFLISVAIPALHRGKEYWRFFFGCSTAWLSHFILDSFYNHGKGIMVMWPISEGRLNLSLPWFSIIPPFPVTWVHVRICLIEFAFYTPFLIAAILIRRAMAKRSTLRS